MSETQDAVVRKWQEWTPDSPQTIYFRENEAGDRARDGAAEGGDRLVAPEEREPQRDRAEHIAARSERSRGRASRFRWQQVETPLGMEEALCLL